MHWPSFYLTMKYPRMAISCIVDIHIIANCCLKHNKLNKIQKLLFWATYQHLILDKCFSKRRCVCLTMKTRGWEKINLFGSTCSIIFNLWHEISFSARDGAREGEHKGLPSDQESPRVSYRSQNYQTYKNFQNRRAGNECARSGLWHPTPSQDEKKCTCFTNLWTHSHLTAMVLLTCFINLKSLL